MSHAGDFDVLIIGAGISGINAGYRIQERFPGYKYAILEARSGLGGTWDLFRYPGIRSDSDLYTFGFPWRPWSEQKYIADGANIRAYIQKSAELYGIDKKIVYNTKVVSNNWSTDSQSWQVTASQGGQNKVYNAKFVIFSTGYYDYDEALPTTIPGLDNFKGTIVHPQFWPEDLDYANKKVVIIGSGATAVTLLPNMADKAAKVTMLQRSPGYLMSRPAIDPIASITSRLLPSWIAHRVTRLQFLILPTIFYNFCRTFPYAARRVLRRLTMRQLPKNVPHDPHFVPAYNPWEQRLCICPDADFYKSLHSGRADIATGHIKTVTGNSILLENGQNIEADIIVTATGLKISLGGGSKLSVDGKPVRFSDKFLWKGMMLQDVPNMAYVIGYTNASWTLGADATAQLVMRLLKHMKNNGLTSAVPRLENASTIKSAPVLNLTSTYVVKAANALPKVTDQGPWQARTSYFNDIWEAKFGSIEAGLQFHRVST